MKRNSALLPNLLPKIFGNWTRQGHVTYVSPAVERIFGYTQEEAMKLGFQSFFPEWELERATDAFKKALFGQKYQLLQFESRKKDGSLFYIEVSVTPIIKNNKIFGVQGIARDITERKNAEKAIQESETRFRTLIESMPVSVLLLQKGKYIYGNPASLQLLGYKNMDDIIGQNPLDTIVPEYHEVVLRRMKQIESGTKNQPIEMQILRPDGTRIWSLSTSVSVFMKGVPTAIIIGQNISELKQVEKNLKQTLEATTDGIWYWHFPTNTLTFSPRYYMMLGYEPDEFPATYENWLGLIHPEDRESAVAVAEEYIKTKPDLYENEFRLRTKSGGYRWIYTKARVVERTAHGDAIFMIGNHEDITERKVMEKSLIESQTKYYALFEQSLEGIFLHDLEGNILDVNNVACIQSGYTKDELVLMTVFDLHPSHVNVINMPPDKIKHQWKQWPTNTRNRIEAEHLCKDGSVMSAQISTGKITINDDIFMIAIVQDITDRKQVENALKENEERFRELFENMGTGVAVYQAVNDGEDFIIRDINPAGARIGRLKREEHIGKKLLDVYPGVKELGLFSVLQDVWQTGKPQHYPLQAYNDNRINIWVENYVCKLATGEVVAVYDDLTDKKNAEQELIESEEKYRTLIENLNEGIWAIDKNGFTSFVNRKMTEILGYSEDDMKGKHLFEFMDEDSVKLAQTNMERRKEGIKEQHEFEFLCKNGNKIYANLLTSPLVDNNGNYIGAIAGVIDITDQKRVEAERERLMLAIGQAAEIIVITDKNGRFSTLIQRLKG